MPDVPEINDEERAASAKKLGLTKYLPQIEQYEMPANQASPNARGNIEGNPNPERFQVPEVDYTPPPAVPRAPSFLDDIPDVVAANDSRQVANAPTFLDDIPDVQTQTEKAYNDASTSDAARNAKVLKYSQHFGQPPEFIDQNMDQADKKAEAPHPSFFHEMEAEYPGSTKFYAKPEMMASAHDDVKNVVEHEKLVKDMVQATTLHEAFRAGYQNSLYGMIYRGQGPQTELGPDATRAQRLMAGAMTFAGDLPFMIAGGIGGAIGGTSVAGPPGAFVGSAAGGFGAPAALKKGILDRFEKGGFKDTKDLLEFSKLTLGEFAKQTAVGLAVQATGGVTGVLAKTAKLGAGATAAAKLATEAGSLEVAGKAVEGEAPTIEGYIDNLLLIGAMHGAGALGDVSSPAEHSKADAAKNFYTALGDTAEASKLRERLPEAHRELVQDLTQDTPVSHIFLPVEEATAYFQGKGIKIDDVVNEMGIREAYDEAKATGGDIKIPLATWVEKVVGTEHYKGLENDIKFHADDLSVNQSTLIRSEVQARVQESAKQAAENAPIPEVTDQNQGIEAAGKIYQDLSNKLSAAGLSQSEVRYDPKLHEAFFTTLAKRINESLPADSQVDPFELQQRFPLEVRRFDSPADRVSAAGLSADSPEGQAMLKEVSQQAKQDRLSLARKAMENIPDVSADAVAEAFGLKKNEVRLLGWKGRRKGKAVETHYSQEEIRAAAGVQPGVDAAGKAFDQASPYWEMPKESPSGVAFPDSVPVTKIETAGSQDIKALRDSVRSDKDIRGSHTNKQTGWDIDISRKGIVRALDLAGTDSNAVEAIRSAPSLIENAIHIATEQNADPTSENDVSKYHEFIAPITIDDKSFLARIRIAENTQGQKYFNQVTVESKRPAGEIQSSETLASKTPGYSGSTVSIAELGQEITQAKREKTFFQGKGNKEVSPTAKALKKELEKSLGKDLGIEISDGGYVREVDHAYDNSYPLEGAQKKRAAKLGFDTEHAWFHGTRADIEEFSGDTLGGSTGAGSARLAHFFASSPETASDYARASNDALSLRSSRTEAEATRAKEDFTSRMREKHGSKWTSKLSPDEKAERAAINKRFEQSAEDFERSQNAQEHKIKFREYEIQQAENNVKFFENSLKTKEYEKKNKESQEYADKLKTLVTDTTFKKTDRGYEITDNSTGKKIPNIHGSNFEDLKFNHYDTEERIKERIAKIEDRISANTRDSLKKGLEEAKSTLEEMKADHLKTLQGAEGQTVYKTVLKTENPLIVDFKGTGYREVTYREIIEKAQAHGYDSVIFKNTFDPAFIGSMAAEPELIDVAAVFEPNQIRSVAAKFDPKMADSANILHQGDSDNPRGQITINGRKFNIDLFKDKDKSTFLHESGHFFLEVMGHVVEGEGKGSEQIQSDYAAILKFLDVHSRDEIGNDQHEKFARAFEEYLSTGEAPSLPLRDAFVRFRKWLTDLWKKVSFSKVEVSPELREVFDRMLAADEEIKQARQSLNMDEEFKIDGLDEATGKKIKDLQNKARARAEETLLKGKLEETKSAYREKLKAEKEKFREAATEQVNQEPVFQAVEGLRKLGGDPYDLAEAALRGELTPEQSAEFELLADEHGYPTAEEMAKAISDAGANGEFEQKVGALVDMGLNQIGMIKDANQLREDAIRAIHSEQMTELLALEREALSDLAHKSEITGEVRRRNRVIAKLEAAAANAEAARILSLKPASEAGRPQIYITQERNAAGRVAKFLAKKDFEKAAQAKKEQMVAHALVRESFKIGEEVEKHNKYITQFTNRAGSLLDMPYGFVRQVDGLLSRFGFEDAKKEDGVVQAKIAELMDADGKDSHEIANATGFVQSEGGKWVPEALPQFIDRQNENYHAIQIADSVLSAGNADHSTLNITELRDLREAVQMIVEGGRKNDRFLSEFIKVDAKAAAKEIRASIEKNIGKPREGDFVIGDTEGSGIGAKLKSIMNLPDSVIPSMVNMETLVHFLDRGEKNGPARRFLYRPMAEAENQKQIRHEKAVDDFNKILEKHYKPDELAKYKTEKKLAIRGFPDTLTKENVLSMALNWGNETNRDRVRRGYKIDEATAQVALETLDKRDWDFVQDTWKYLDSYWPEIKALEMKVKGVEPRKVESTKVVTKFGVYEGGYYPIAYDFTKSADAFQMAEQRSELYKQFSAVAAHTERGHAEARVNRVSRPVRLSLGVMFDHLENVIHDLSYREAVIDVNRMLKDHDVKTSVQNAVGLKGNRMMSQWLTDIASDQRGSLQDGEQLLKWFRMKATMSTLSFRAFTFPMDVTGNMVNVIHEIGPQRMMRAVGDHVFGKGETREFVDSASPYMNQRGKTLDRDLADLNRRWTLEKPLLDRAVTKVTGKDIGLRNFAFFFQRFADDAVAMPLWKEVYRDSLGKAGHDDSVHMADEAVKRTLGSGSHIDLVGVQKGSEAKKILSMYYSWSSMMFNRAWLDGKISGLEYREGNYLPALAVAARGAFFLWALHAVNETFWRELFYNARNGNANPDDRKKRIAGRLATQPFSYIWLGRDIANIAASSMLGERGNFKLSPIEQAVDSVVVPAGKAVNIAFSPHKHFDQRFFEDSAKAASIILGSPKTLNDMAFNFIDTVNNNGQATWRDALQRRHKK